MMKTLALVVLLIASPITTVELPFTINRCDVPVVKVMVEGREATLIVDTGASRTELDKRFQHLVSDNKTVQLMIGDHNVRVKVGVRDFSYARRLCGQVDGVLGDRLARSRRAVIDYENKILILDYRR